MLIFEMFDLFTMFLMEKFNIIPDVLISLQLEINLFLMIFFHLSYLLFISRLLLFQLLGKFLIFFCRVLDIGIFYLFVCL